MKKILDKLRKETVFIIATFLALLTSIIRLPKLSYIDIDILMILFNLMVVVELYKREKVLDAIAIKFLKSYRNQRNIARVLILLVFFSSMLLTNDVALLTFVPLTMIIGKQAKFSILRMIILETIAANLGSSLTPMGNPQNLYIYSKYMLKSAEFFKVTAAVAIFGLCLLFVATLIIPRKKVIFNLEEIRVEKNSNVFVGSFIFLAVLVNIFFKLSILGITLCTILYLLYKRSKEVLLKIDWSLLATFISFFIFVGNLSNISFIKEYMLSILGEPSIVYFLSIGLSQIISNVPTAILISEFTPNWKPLLIGVNVGGLGTLVASLASLISYKIYTNEFQKDKKIYLKEFSILNIILLFLMSLVFYYNLDKI